VFQLGANPGEQRKGKADVDRQNIKGDYCTTKKGKGVRGGRQNFTREGHATSGQGVNEKKKSKERFLNVGLKVSSWGRGGKKKYRGRNNECRGGLSEEPSDKASRSIGTFSSSEGIRGGGERGFRKP